VHAFGHPVDLDPIVSLARAAGIPLIEDVSQAFGARYKGRLVGTDGDINIQSFFSNKIITTGEGGAAVTDNEELSERLSDLRNHCESPVRKYLHSSIGYSYRMTGLQAALGISQLSRIDEILVARRNLLMKYRGFLKDVPGVEINPECDWATPVNWMVCLRLPGKPLSESSLLDRFNEAGIDVRPGFIPLNAQPALDAYALRSETPIARDLSPRLLILPSGSRLTESEIGMICEIVREDFKQ